MDREFLRTLGIVPRTFETAELKNWSITFSPLATLIQSKGDSVYGVLAELSHTQAHTLYSREDMKPYHPVEIEIATKSDARVPVRTYISEPWAGQKPSVEYLQRVVRAAESLGFPQAYLAKLRRTQTTQT